MNKLLFKSVALNLVLFIAALPSAKSAQVSSMGFWQSSGDLHVARSRHTATLLPNETVLVTGGYTGALNSPASTSSVEIFTPAANGWNAAAPMLAARSRHTATLLPDGKVLVAGGRDDNNLALASAELYDIQTGIWSVTGSMHTPRMDHTATLLSDGRVLVTGGQSVGDGPDNFIEKTTEIYDPDSGQWTDVEKMSTARYGHTAGLLRNGSVLVAGGAGPSGDAVYTIRAEIFNPSTNKWKNIDSLITSRGFHTAVVLGNGTVLVAGGFTLPANSFNRTASAELYHPSTNQWITTDDLNIPRNAGNNGGVLLSDGGFFIAGGRSNTAEIYDPNTGTWTSVDNMVTERSRHTVTLLSDGRVLVVGGENRFGFVSATEIYAP